MSREADIKRMYELEMNLDKALSALREIRDKMPKSKDKDPIKYYTWYEAFARAKAALALSRITGCDLRGVEKEEKSVGGKK